MSKPLKSVMQRVTVQGFLKGGYSDTITDEHGNPESILVLGKLELTVKFFDNQPQYRESYGIIGARSIVECHILKSWIKSESGQFITKKLDPSDFKDSLKNESIILTILETNQSNLIPLTKVMGVKFKAILDGQL